ncbi:unnamed protein product [Mytilus coruscus]|uniref:SMB domain-containing protein n=1 Tax=Mytilus coruscus TaxID=42192 RepID=A0A6J8DAZ8_MYTCO|nr:unnamed protein product [Mytilus coruscus]
MIGVLLVQFLILLCTGKCKDFVHCEDVNLTFITDMYAEFCGKTECNSKRAKTTHEQNILVNDSFCPDCSCQVSCFISGNCCPDVFFDNEPTCIDTNVLLAAGNRQREFSKAILMQDKCPNKSNEELSKLCNMSSDLETQLQNVPVTSITSGLTFRNIYCLQCFNDSLEYAKHWSLEIDCEEEGNLNFMSNYSQIIKLSKSKKCDLFYDTSFLENYTRSCQMNENIISMCNVSGTWNKYDSNIEYACKVYDNNFYMFKNIYCYMCNPPEKSDVITGCNITESLDNTINVTRVHQIVHCGRINILQLHYQLTLLNYSCKPCNSSIGSDIKIHEQLQRKFSVRNLFNFSRYKDSSYETKVFDPNKNEYRNIMCYPGRILTIAGCVPLLQTTRNIGYIVSLGLTTELASNINETVPFLKSVKMAFRKYLKHVLHIRKVNFTSSIFWANSNCAENIIWQKDTELNISVFQKIMILDYVDRLKLERKLISIYNSDFLVSHDHKKYTFKVFKNVEALSIVSYSSTMGFVKSCFIRKIKKDSHVYSKVNSLLTCQQLELEMTEFRINSLTLTILAKTMELDYDEYAIMSSVVSSPEISTIIVAFVKQSCHLPFSSATWFPVLFKVLRGKKLSILTTYNS